LFIDLAAVFGAQQVGGGKAGGLMEPAGRSFNRIEKRSERAFLSLHPVSRY
jgi:hypothetical protein